MAVAVLHANPFLDHCGGGLTNLFESFLAVKAPATYDAANSIRGRNTRTWDREAPRNSSP
jgi:hypothetical protein